MPLFLGSSVLQCKSTTQIQTFASVRSAVHEMSPREGSHDRSKKSRPSIFTRHFDSRHVQPIEFVAK
jgi:hypothetical protein